MYSYHGLLISFFDVEKQKPFKEMFSSGMGGVWILFYVALMPSIWEELMFRGILLKELERIITPLEAAILSSVIFGYSPINI